MSKMTFAFVTSLGSLGASLLVAGCATTAPVVVGNDHPASADAMAAPARAPSQTLALEGDASTSGPPAMGAAAPTGNMPGNMPGNMTGNMQSPSGAGTTRPAAGDQALYACPMHPEVTSTDPTARCPKCGMRINKLVSAPSPATSPANDAGGHQGHNSGSPEGGR